MSRLIFPAVHIRNANLTKGLSLYILKLDYAKILYSQYILNERSNSDNNFLINDLNLKMIKFHNLQVLCILAYLV